MSDLDSLLAEVRHRNEQEGKAAEKRQLQWARECRLDDAFQRLRGFDISRFVDQGGIVENYPWGNWITPTEYWVEKAKLVEAVAQVIQTDGWPLDRLDAGDEPKQIAVGLLNLAGTGGKTEVLAEKLAVVPLDPNDRDSIETQAMVWLCDKLCRELVEAEQENATSADATNTATSDVADGTKVTALLSAADGPREPDGFAWGGVEVTLQRKPWTLVKLLFDAPGRTASEDTLVAGIYGHNETGTVESVYKNANRAFNRSGCGVAIRKRQERYTLDLT